MYFGSYLSMPKVKNESPGEKYIVILKNRYSNVVPGIMLRSLTTL